MQYTTDGMIQIWAVFDADGCECESLVGIFETEAAAEKVALEYSNGYRNWHIEHARGRYEWLGRCYAKPITLNSYEPPPIAIQPHHL